MTNKREENSWWKTITDVGLEKRLLLTTISDNEPSHMLPLRLSLATVFVLCKSDSASFLLFKTLSPNWEVDSLCITFTFDLPYKKNGLFCFPECDYKNLFLQPPVGCIMWHGKNPVFNVELTVFFILFISIIFQQD